MVPRKLAVKKIERSSRCDSYQAVAKISREKDPCKNRMAAQIRDFRGIRAARVDLGRWQKEPLGVWNKRFHRKKKHHKEPKEGKMSTKMVLFYSGDTLWAPKVGAQYVKDGNFKPLGEVVIIPASKEWMQGQGRFEPLKQFEDWIYSWGLLLVKMPTSSAGAEFVEMAVLLEGHHLNEMDGMYWYPGNRGAWVEKTAFKALWQETGNVSCDRLLEAELFDATVEYLKGI